MSNELTTLTTLPVSLPKTDLTKYSANTEFLQRIQLASGNDKYSKRGKIQAGHYGVPDNNDGIFDLGASIDVLTFACRDKALDTTEDPPLAVFDANDPVFQDIEKRAGEKDSGCMFGPSFLVFERNTEKFYEFFCGTISARVESGNFLNYLPISEEQAIELQTAGQNVQAQAPQPMTIRAKYIERPRQAWYAPQVTKCSTPFTNLPPIDQIVLEMNKFLNPETQEVCIAEDERDR